MESEIAEGHDLGIMPTELGGVIHHKHMIRKDLAEAQSLGIGLCLRCCCFDDFNGVHVINLLFLLNLLYISFEVNVYFVFLL